MFAIEKVFSRKIEKSFYFAQEKFICSRKIEEKIEKKLLFAQDKFFSEWK